MKRQLTVIAAAALTLTVCSAGAASAGITWTSEPVPLPANWGHGIGFSGVSCASPDSCIAVGYYYYKHSRHQHHALAEYWNGSSWAIQQLAKPGSEWSSVLSGVTCLSQRDCTAVGDTRGSTLTTVVPLAERWNGSSWTVQPAQSPSAGLVSQLSSVSCTSAARCTAVGYYYNSSGARFPLAERWHGNAWVIQRTPVPVGSTDTSLNGVSCTSTTSCIAVGSYDNSSGASQTLAEYWNGQAWTLQPSPSPSGSFSSSLNGISCVSAASCTAVGSSNYSRIGVYFVLAEYWNGSTWSVQATPDRVYSLNAVSCPSATSCTAVGSGPAGLAMYWNGSVWKQQQTIHPARHDRLSGVSCTYARTCTAVGSVGHPASRFDWPALAEQE